MQFAPGPVFWLKRTPRDCMSSHSVTQDKTTKDKKSNAKRKYTKHINIKWCYYILLSNSVTFLRTLQRCHKLLREEHGLSLSGQALERPSTLPSHEVNNQSENRSIRFAAQCTIRQCRLLCRLFYSYFCYYTLGINMSKKTQFTWEELSSLNTQQNAHVAVREKVIFKR